MKVKAQTDCRGDGGGPRITSKGEGSLSLFDPSLRYQFRALNYLFKAGQRMPEKVSGRRLGKTITKLTGAVLTQLEAIVGEIASDNGLVYYSHEGGFSCGSTGGSSSQLDVLSFLIG